MKHVILAVLLLVGQQAADKQGKVLNKKTTADTRDWCLYVPSSYKAGTPMPFVLTSHGAGGRGAGEIGGWTALADKNKFIVAAADFSIAANRPGTIEDDEKVALEIYEYVTKNFTIDKKAVMVTGFSGGGITTYYMGSHHPDKFPFWCPRGGNYYVQFLPSDEDLKKLADRPVYVFWGTEDHPLILDQAPQAIKRMQDAGFRYLKTNQIKGMKHESRPEEAATWFMTALDDARKREALAAPATKSIATAEKLLEKGKLAEAVKELVKADQHLKKNKLGDEAELKLTAAADSEIERAGKAGGDDEVKILTDAKKAFEGTEQQKKIVARLKELGKE